MHIYKLWCIVLVTARKQKHCEKHIDSGGFTMKEKVVLAYSGGLDTTAIIPWLKENFGYEVICCCVNCGQGEELDGLDERARLSGASKLYIEDIAKVPMLCPI